MSPHAIDYFPFPPVAHASPYEHQPLFAPPLTDNVNVHLSQHRASDAELYARTARSKSLSSVAPIQSFNPFIIPVSPPPAQPIGRLQHPLDVSRIQHRHASMPNAAVPPTDWIRPSDIQPASHQQQLMHQALPQPPSLINPFVLENEQQQAIRRMATPAAQPALGLNEVRTFLRRACNDNRRLPMQPINFLRLLQPSAHPPYDLFVHRIVKSSDQQASIFLQQKLKMADGLERMRIVDAITEKGFEMMVGACVSRSWQC